jgi:hypothetical protein
MADVENLAPGMTGRELQAAIVLRRRDLDREATIRREMGSCGDPRIRSLEADRESARTDQPHDRCRHRAHCDRTGSDSGRDQPCSSGGRIDVGLETLAEGGDIGGDSQELALLVGPGEERGGRCHVRLPDVP